jgi:hypothetical protein
VSLLQRVWYIVCLKKTRLIYSSIDYLTWFVDLLPFAIWVNQTTANEAKLFLHVTSPGLSFKPLVLQVQSFYCLLNITCITCFARTDSVVHKKQELCPSEERRRQAPRQREHLARARVFDCSKLCPKAAWQVTLDPGR